jgi:hypothetical protein
MTTPRGSSLAAILVLGFSSHCFAQFNVSFFPTGIRPNIDNVAPGVSVDLGSVEQTITRINVFGTAATDIGRISLDPGASRSLPLQVHIGTGEINPDETIQLLNVANNFAGLSIPPGREQYVLYSGGIAGNLTGSLHVGRIVRLQVGGAVQADVSAITNGPAGQATIGAAAIGSLAATATIRGTATSSPGLGIGPVTVTGTGNALMGTVGAPAGNINSVTVPNGNIGQAGAPATIQARDGIGPVAARNAWVTLQANANNGAGSLVSLRATTGQLDCQIQAQNFPPIDARIDIAPELFGAPQPSRVVIDCINLRQMPTAFPGGFLPGSTITVHGDMGGSLQAGSTPGVSAPLDRLEVFGDIYNPVGIENCTLANLIQIDDGIEMFIVHQNFGQVAQNGSLCGPHVISPMIGTFFVGGYFRGRLFSANPADDLLTTVNSFTIGDSLIPTNEATDPDDLKTKLWIHPLNDVIIGGSIQSDTTLTVSRVPANKQLVIGQRVGGLLRFTQPGPIQGQVIGNAAAQITPTPQTPFGSVDIPPVVVVNHLGYTSAGAGPGSIGMAPYALNVARTNELNQQPDGSTKVIWSRWSDLGCSQRDAVRLEFFGPVKRDPAVPAYAPLLKLVYLDSVQTVGGQFISAADLTSFVDFAFDPTNPRIVLMTCKSTFALPWGNYMVSSWADGRVPPLVCDGLISPTTVVPVRTVLHTFSVGRDCSPIDCTIDITCNNQVFPRELCDPIDFNNDGLYPDTLDIDDFLLVFAGGVCNGQAPNDWPCNGDIDINNDSLFPDTLDIDAFISVFSGGPCM